MALVLTGSSTAWATYEGTPGKVAYLGPDEEGWPLKLWDPVTEAPTTLEASTWDGDNVGTGTDIHGAQHRIGSGDLPGTPSWSPDGSQLAYAKLIPDNGDFQGLRHSAIFVHTVATGQTRKVTTPQDGVLDKVPEDPPVFGHVVSDYAPAWSPDGQTLAFIRVVQALGPDDPLWDQRGRNLWRVPAGGGDPTQVTRFTGESPERIYGAAWIPGTQDLIVSYLDGGGQPSLGRLTGGSGTPTFLTGSLSEVITDWDVSPDGKKLAFMTLGAGGTTPFVMPLTGAGAGVGVSAGQMTGAILRFAPTGDGLLHDDCTTRDPSVCGLVNRLTADSDADIDPGEADRLALAWSVPTPGSGGTPGRIAFDIQPQELPIIFLPGFLGTRIQCGSAEGWPDLPFPDLLRMSLGADGQSDAGCQPGAVLETALRISDVYKTVADYVRSEYGTRGTLFGWDWRKRPQPSFEKLETAITDALARDGPWKQQDAGRVVLWGHSYGGLFIRAFIEGPGGRRVARVLTAGTPYWGSPKSFFALAFGVESPGFSVMDAVIDNARLQGLSRNLSGLYNLYPSANHPAWLSIGGTMQSQAGVSSAIDVLGGNSALFNQAAGDHANVFDGFYDDGGRIDVRAVVGTGLNTIRSVNVVFGEDGDFEEVNGSFDNGDETVPARSGAQGPVGVKPPLGDPIHVQYTCNVSHVPLSGTPSVLAAYEDFLDTGKVPRKLPPACGSAGGAYRFAPDSIGIANARRSTDAAGPLRLDDAPRSTDAAGPLSLDDAEQQGLADVMELGPTVLAVVNDVRPVTLSVPIANGTFTYTPLAGDRAGSVSVYGPATGTLQLSPGTPGAAPVVLLDGAPLAPHATPTDPAGPSSPSAPGSGPGASPPTVTPPMVTPQMKLVGRPRLRGRKLKVVLDLPGRGALALRVTARRRTLGTAKASIRARGRRTIAVKLKRRPPAKVRLAIAFTPQSGARQTRAVLVKRSR